MSKKRPSDEVSALDQLRDEAQVQAHLGKAEAREKFGRLHARYRKLRHDLLAAKAIARTTRDDLGSALDLATDSLRRHYGELKALVAN